KLDVRQIPLRRALDAPFDFANRGQIAVQNDAVPRIEIALQQLRAVIDAVQQADVLPGDRITLLVRVALAEKLDEDLPWIEFHRQRRCRIAERQRGTVIASRAAAR